MTFIGASAPVGLRRGDSDPEAPPSRNYAQLATCSLVTPELGDPQAAQTTLLFEPTLTPSDCGVARDETLTACLLALTA